MQLLRLSLIKGFEIKTASTVSSSKAEFERSIERLIEDIAPIGMSYDYWKDYLKNIDQESILIKEAFGKDIMTSPKHYIQMFSRAFLLLRIAIGFNLNNLSSVDISKEDLKFWWFNTGKNLGFWDANFDNDELKDFLFADVMDSKDELINWYNIDKTLINPFTWSNNLHEAKSKITQIERIAIAGTVLT